MKELAILEELIHPNETMVNAISTDTGLVTLHTYFIASLQVLVYFGCSDSETPVDDAPLVYALAPRARLVQLRRDRRQLHRVVVVEVRKEHVGLGNHSVWNAYQFVCLVAIGKSDTYLK